MSNIAIQSRLCLIAQRSSTLIIQKRFSVREEIHRYREPDKFKKHMLAASEPYFKRKYILPAEKCPGSGTLKSEMEPLQKIYVNELLDAVQSNDFILFLQHNYTPFQSERVYKNTLIKSGGLFYSHRNVVYKEVFGNLGIDKVQHLFISRNSLVLGKLEKLPGCVKALRKMPQFLLLAGCIENEVYSHDQLELFSSIPDLDLCRAKLASILETPAIELYQNLKLYVEMNPTGDSVETEKLTIDQQQSSEPTEDDSNK